MSPRVEDHAADQLDVEGPHAKGALGGLANRREGGNQEVVERGAVCEVGAEGRRSWRQSSSSVSVASSFSIALMASTRGRIDLTRRSFDDPKILRARPPRLTIQWSFQTYRQAAAVVLTPC